MTMTQLNDGEKKKKKNFIKSIPERKWAGNRACLHVTDDDGNDKGNDNDQDRGWGVSSTQTRHLLMRFL